MRDEIVRRVREAGLVRTKKIAQREPVTQQEQGSSSGKAHDRITDDDINGGGPSGAAAIR